MIPIVNMRLEAGKWLYRRDLKKDSTLPYSRYVFTREYRCTFRDSLTSTEKITKGKWIGNAPAKGLPPISMEENYATEKRHQYRRHDYF